MTKKKPNSARGRIRSELADFLADYARKHYMDAEAGLRLKGAPAKRAAVARKRSPLPEPDLSWAERGSAIWKFYILPEPSAVRRLAEGVPFLKDTIVYSDKAGSIGFIEPLPFLRFLDEESAGEDHARILALMECLPAAAPLQPPSQFNGTVVDSAEFIRDHFSLKVKAPYAQRPLPGQFLQVMCDPVPHVSDPKYRSFEYSEKTLPRLRGIELLERRPFLRRPFSIASYKAGPADANEAWLDLVTWLGAEFEIIYRRIPGGPGTGALSRYAAGDKIDIVGPLGKGFAVGPIPEIALLVGGGIGAPPLIFLAEELSRRGCEVKLFLGAVSKDRIPFCLEGENGDTIERFERMGLCPAVCTDDGSAGIHGLVTKPLLEYLEQNQGRLASMKMFACGPRPLLSALNGIANRFHLPCEVLLEERMACGIGACISCVCAVKEPGQKAHFTRICVEGPAFDVRKVMWHA
ncbi:MAG: dihydroorotate dehydrogenase electron transfer subunit [Candidatus Abyssobacteria bacterium SURF_5]|uniref:Dihydroorotate dehydrogenase electron transfer subunit n=1 Tax=Abyssobacteria bacterium (strain SURF_5) TaxID=2093360 RepID=A0A3A4N6L5_ABYX5|nr:MAG: dihydroorotate dehydrogenase electron transfer subunit [Candidatus Abyssubacteria bacterium SURF_5]